MIRYHLNQPPSHLFQSPMRHKTMSPILTSTLISLTRRLPPSVPRLPTRPTPSPTLTTLNQVIRIPHPSLTLFVAATVSVNTSQSSSQAVLPSTTEPWVQWSRTTPKGTGWKRRSTEVIAFLTGRVPRRVTMISCPFHNLKSSRVSTGNTWRRAGLTWLGPTHSLRLPLPWVIMRWKITYMSWTTRVLG